MLVLDRDPVVEEVVIYINYMYLFVFNFSILYEVYNDGYDPVTVKGRERP